MIRVVGIGACVMDTLITVPSFPTEDTKMRAESTKLAGGGPTATGIVAVSKLGISSGFIGVLSKDSAGDFLRSDFEKYGVDTGNIDIIDGYRAFTSCIWLSKESTSRTCVFDKGNLPALTLDEAKKKAIAEADILMVDGNELSAAIEAAKYAKEHGTKVLYDAGGLYPGIEGLLPYVDILIPSKEYALGHTKCENVEEAAKKLFEMYNPEVVVITMGKDGGILYDGERITSYPIYPAEVVDSNGAGDVFHGAFAAGLCYGFDFLKCCHFSSAVSAMKCMSVGARESVPSYEAVKEYLKNNGFEI
ncbi:MAG: carbohydrate kinase family protein [Clostridia bacterium]|nr:carbohydrate kinase family protein [Clostridia bacterium]